MSCLESASHVLATCRVYVDKRHGLAGGEGGDREMGSEDWQLCGCSPCPRGFEGGACGKVDRIPPYYGRNCDVRARGMARNAEVMWMAGQMLSVFWLERRATDDRMLYG